MTEKESLLVLNQEIKSDLSFCRDCAVSQGATGWVKDFDRLLEKNEILNNKLNQQFPSHSKLSIPKDIAEELDKELKNSEDKLYTFNKCYEDMTLPYKLLLHKNYALICAYLAGKALGVELVSIEG